MNGKNKKDASQTRLGSSRGRGARTLLKKPVFTNPFT